MQAARGASLSDADPHETEPSPTRWSRVRLFGAVALTAYAVDVVTKQLAVARLADGDVPVFGDWFVLHLTRNPGAAFSAGADYTVALSLLALTAVVVVLWFVRKAGTAGWAIALALLWAGAAGNLTDRLLREPGPLRGHVVDMFMLPHWPVFNVADVCINVAAALILLQTFRGVPLEGRRPEPGR